MSENIIDVSNISKSFGGRKVVDGLSLSVAQGEVFGLLGHNGAGKSTTIEMILGTKKPDGGSAHILGKDAASARKEIFEKVGVQLQSSAYQAAIKVGEICEEFASLYNEPADYRNLLEQFGLLPLIKSPVMKLSGGERQKLSVVLAMIGKPLRPHLSHKKRLQGNGRNSQGSCGRCNYSCSHHCGLQHRCSQNIQMGVTIDSKD